MPNKGIGLMLSALKYSITYDTYSDNIHRLCFGIVRMYTILPTIDDNIVLNLPCPCKSRYRYDNLGIWY